MMPARARAAASRAKNIKRQVTPPPALPPALPPTPPPTVGRGTPRGKRAARPVTPPPATEGLPPTPPPTVKRKRKAPPAPEEEQPPRTLYPLGEAAPALLPPVLAFELSSAVEHLRNVDPRFGKFATSFPCKPFAPPLTAICPFRTLVTSIIGQQVSWMAARAINNRFKQMFGFGDDSDGFPTPAAVARAQVPDLKAVGLSTRKAEYVISLAEHFMSGQISTELLQNGTDEEVASALIAIRGIGQWTVDMFSIFTLRRADVLPVGDLGVQKGLLRWALAAHDALPVSKAKDGKASNAAKKKYSENVKVEEDKTETIIRTPPPQTAALPPTPITPPQTAAIRAEDDVSPSSDGPTPAEVIDVPAEELPVHTPAEVLRPMTGDPTWSAGRAAPLRDGLTVEVMRSRLAGKKAKGGVYLTAPEMESLTDAWRPYRSLGVYWMWPAGEDY